MTGTDPVLLHNPGLLRLGQRPAPLSYLRELWNHRALLLALPAGQLRAQHMNTVLGGSWHLVNPLLSAALYWVIFDVVLNVGAGMENYPAFLVVGLFVFYYTQKSLVTGARTVVANIRLIQSVSFPRAILPITAVATETVAQAPAVAVMLLLVLLAGGTPRWTWLLIPAAYGTQLLFNLGLACIAGRAAFHFRDVEQLIPYGLRLWLYASGVFFSADRIPAGIARELFALQPTYVYVDLVRRLALDGGAPVRSWVAALLWGTVALAAGFAFFYAHEAEYGNDA